MIETILSTSISIVVSVIMTILSIRYSSRFHIKKKGKAKEKYVVVEKVALGTNERVIDSARIVLTKSSMDNAMGFMDISLTEHPENIVVDRYAFTHSYIHNIFAPGKIILNHKKSWQENTPSNRFNDYVTISKKLDSIPVNLINKKIRGKITECRAVVSTFSYPPAYKGPRYKKRLLLIAKGIGIVHSETEYLNGDKDVYELARYKISDGKDYWLPVNKVGNYWEYEISYEYGPNIINLCE
ncbi:MAG: hypothetical protein D3914_06755 [Candidatus Electrothrix sp. LOE2]|nr:hypothetical protein [Candidatus Electrothrix sp. LOE2]